MEQETETSTKQSRLNSLSKLSIGVHVGERSEQGASEASPPQQNLGTLATPVTQPLLGTPSSKQATPTKQATTRDPFILLLREARMHPNSYIKKVVQKFEQPSILTISQREVVGKYTSPPIYDDYYLVLFEDLNILKGNLEKLQMDFMLPILSCYSNATLEDAKALLEQKGFKYRVLNNKFDKSDAVDLILTLAGEQVSDLFCTSLITQVGLNPGRIISAMSVCCQMGFTKKVIDSYIDKYTYTDIHDILDTLLGIATSEAQTKRTIAYLHSNRFWYAKFTRAKLVNEIDLILEVYQDILAGKLNESNLNQYLEAKKLSRYNLGYISNLFQNVGITKLLTLRTLVENSTLLEIVSRVPPPRQKSPSRSTHA